MLVSSALSFIPIAGPFVAAAGSRALNTVQQAEQQRETEKHNAAVAHFISAGTISHFAFTVGGFGVSGGGNSRSLSLSRVLLSSPI
jgi:hypothetical protein